MKITNYLRAGFPLFWLNTIEPNRVREIVYPEIKNFQRKDGEEYKILEWTCNLDPNPLKALEQLNQADDFSIMFAHNYHMFVNKPQIIQTIQDNMLIWASNGKALVCIAPTKTIPAEIQKDFFLIDLPLPEKEEIEIAICNMASVPEMIPSKKKMDELMSSCKGLTRSELDQVLALSLVEGNNKNFSKSVINDYKAVTIRKTGFLDILKPDINFSDIIGYENIKSFILETIDNPKAKGIMTIGPPGCGKTALMKAIVGETGKLGLSVNMERLFSKYQGETGKNIEIVIDIITALGDCLILIDEFDKQFAGASGNGSLDSGTTRRATSRWLDFLQDRPEGVYIVGTANSFAGIPGEYLRPGRWDTSPFFIDLPTQKVKKKILKYYAKKMNLKVPKNIPSNLLGGFTGAEVESLVHIATMRNIGIENAIKCIIPQTKTMAEDISALREWAKNRTIPAEEILTKKLSRRKIDI